MVLMAPVSGNSEWAWPSTEPQLIELQLRLAVAASEVLTARPWLPGTDPLVAGCFLAYARGQAGPGNPGDQGWAAAVLWRARAAGGEPKGGDRRLAVPGPGPPRSPGGVEARVVVVGQVPASYTPGLLALREGPLLADSLSRLGGHPDVLMVDASGLDHPRRAGLAVQLGAALDLPSVGVTHRPLVARGNLPLPRRGSSTPLFLGPTVVGAWVCTRSGARPVVAHAGWRTDPETAVGLVLDASSAAARTPIPLQEARRVAREARARAER
jgi:deoxyribonuclease V